MKNLEAYFWLVTFVALEVVLSVLSPFIKITAVFAQAFGKGRVKQWGYNNFIALDNYRSSQLGGDPEETISSRLGKARLRGRSKTFIFLADKVDLVFKVIKDQDNHCVASIEREEGDKQVTRY